MYVVKTIYLLLAHAAAYQECSHTDPMTHTRIIINNYDDVTTYRRYVARDCDVSNVGTRLDVCRGIKRPSITGDR